MFRKLSTFFLLLVLVSHSSAQDSLRKKTPVKLTGVVGVTYEGYGLSRNPGGNGFYNPRRPYNQIRFLFTPVLQYKKFTIPVNFNFAAMARNAAGPYAGLEHQSVG
ncbi:MAG TPA: hypothetical protein VF145_04235, partial [Chitinophagaceae bacterium]